MKKILILIAFISVLNAKADIEVSNAEPAKATLEEINQSRSCFHEVEVQGCPDPGDDAREFRTCLKEIFPTLTSSCRKKMTELYNVK